MLQTRPNFTSCLVRKVTRPTGWPLLPGIMVVGLVVGAVVARAEDGRQTSELQNIQKQHTFLHPFCRNKKWGYLDRCGNVAIPARFDKAHEFYEGLAAVSIESDDPESGYIRPDGKWAFKMPSWPNRAFGQFSEGRALFIESQRLGYLDAEGRVVIEPRFTDAHDFSDGRARVADGKWIHEFPRPRLQAKWGFIDRNGNLVVPIDLESADNYSDGLALVGRSNSWRGYIDRDGKATIDTDKLLLDPALHTFLNRSFHDGLAPFEVTGRAMHTENGMGYFDKSGRVAIQPQFLHAKDFSEGLAAVRTAAGTGFIDRQGRVVIAPQFDRANSFHEGLAAVQCGREWFFVDRCGCRISSRNCDLAGNFVAAAPWNVVEDFRGGLARVHVGGEYHDVFDAPGYWKGGIWYYVDSQGSIVSICHQDGDPAGALGYPRQD